MQALFKRIIFMNKLTQKFTYVCAVQYSSVNQMFINISSHFHCQYLQMTCLSFTRVWSPCVYRTH